MIRRASFCSPGGRRAPTPGDEKGEDHRVVLRFPEELGPLVENARHHPDEEVEPAADEEGWIEYRVRLSTLDEIARWIVGFGGQVRVVEPEELRQKVRGLAEGVLRGVRITRSD